MESLRLTCRMAEFRATHLSRGASARSEGLGIFMITELGMPYLDRQLASESLVTTDLYELVPIPLGHPLH